MNPVNSRPAEVASQAGGALLATGTRALAALRPAAKPLHPAGEVTKGRLRRTGCRQPTGVAWLDEAGEDEVLVRVSRAVGLPDALPDIHGLALRIPVTGGHHADVLFASTGTGTLSRFLLTASRSIAGRPLTTLLPYKSPGGPLLLAARPLGETVFALACASPTGRWRPFGELTLTTEVSEGGVSFDPVLNALPDLQFYEWVRRLREPAYLTARRSRS